MQKLSKRERTMVVICVLFLLATVVFVMTPSGKPVVRRVLLPTESADIEWRKKAKTYTELADQEQTLQARLNEVTYKESPDTVAALATQDLQDIAARSNVHLRETKPVRVSKTKSGQLVRVQLEVRFRATFQPDVMRFLYYVENPSRRMVVDKIDITSADSRFKKVEISARISVFTQAVSGGAGTGEGETSDGSERSG